MPQRRLLMVVLFTTASLFGATQTGCTSASVDVIRLTHERFPPKTSDEAVDVLKHIPAQPHIELADLSITDTNTSADKLEHQLLKRAAGLGADAVVLSTPHSFVEHQVAYDSPLGYGWFGAMGGYGYPGMGRYGYGGMGWGSPWGMGWGSPWGMASYAVPYDVTVTTIKGTAIRYIH